MEVAHVKGRRELPDRPLLREVKGLYFTHQGVPKKEYMKSIYQWFDILEKELEPVGGDMVKRHYQLGYAGAVKASFKRWCLEHHIDICTWTDQVSGVDYIGFTNDPDKYKEGAKQIEASTENLVEYRALQIDSQQSAAKRMRRRLAKQ